MESSEPDSRIPEVEDQHRETLDSIAVEQASSSRSSDVSSESTLQSPSLSPIQNHPMTNSIISNLDLSEDDRGVGSSTSAQDTSEAPNTKFEYSNGRIAPLAPRDVLGQSASLSSIALSPISSETTLPEHTNEGSNFSTPGADDSALDALVAAHERQDSLPCSPQAVNNFSNITQAKTSLRKGEHDMTPDTRDASFGLDPDADTSLTIEGSPFRASHSSSNKHHRHSSREKNVYEMEEANAPSHTTTATGAPKTMKTDMQHTQTVPTASSTGMPRFGPRRTSRSPSNASSRRSSHSSQPSPPKEIMPNYPPSGSLTLAIFANGITWKKRGCLLLASVAINLGLPFINGVMLGFGEIFARTIVAPWIGLAPASININAPGPRSTAATSTNSGVGLRYAGVGESRGASGNVSVESWEVEPGQRGRGKAEHL